MDAPPDKEPITAFINIGRALTTLNIRTPNIYAFDEQAGFILLEDFGDQLFLNNLNPTNADLRYRAAMDVLHKLATCTPEHLSLPYFDVEFILKELHLFRTWFLEEYLKLNLTAQEQNIIHSLNTVLLTYIIKQPYICIHRDYHSRNLMIIQENDNVELGVIDFQDAMYGPCSYDLVSLLKDCYIEWSPQQINLWLDYFYQTSPISNAWSFEQFTQSFHWCGLQRHLKVLGVFARLHLRDNKPAYLKNLPLTMQYVLTCSAQYSEFKDFARFLHTRVYPTFIEKHRI